MQTNNNNNLIRVNDVLLVRKGKDNKLVAFDVKGKVVIPANHITSEGFYTVKKFTEKCKCYLADLVREANHDAYIGMDYHDFLKVAHNYGYTKVYSECYDLYGKLPSEFIVFVNKGNGNICKADFIEDSKTGTTTLDKVKIYTIYHCENNYERLSCRSRSNLYEFMEDDYSLLSLYDNSKITNNISIFEVADRLKTADKSRVWHSNAYFSFLNKQEIVTIPNSKTGYSVNKVDDITIAKVKAFPKDVWDVLKDCKQFEVLTDFFN